MAKNSTAAARAEPRTASAKSVPAPVNAMALERILQQLESRGNEATWKQNARWATGGIQPGATQFDVRHGDIGEKLGVYRDYPVSKSCTSPFAPIWINTMVSRKG